MTPEQQWPLWLSAASRTDVNDGLLNLYQSIKDQVQQKGPVCWASGRCCKFDTFRGDGHRLYVTGLEIAWVLNTIRNDPANQWPHITAGDVDLEAACPYQIKSLCSIHEIRPMGCRVFFCQRGTEDWQHQLYEDMLGNLKDLHARWDLPYQYMEWRTGLKEGLNILAAKLP